MLKRVLKDIFASRTVVHEQGKTIVDDSADCHRWFEQLIDRMFQLMHKVEEDNFDAAR